MSKIERLPGLAIVFAAMLIPLMLTSNPFVIAVASAAGGMIGGLWIGDVAARENFRE